VKLARFSRRNLYLVTAWSALCALASQIHFPHFLFICESVEAAYGGMANDAVVLHVMQAILGLLWLFGIVSLGFAAHAFRILVTRRRSRAGT
jgi:hypothetical protein